MRSVAVAGAGATLAALSAGAAAFTADRNVGRLPLAPGGAPAPPRRRAHPRPHPPRYSNNDVDSDAKVDEPVVMTEEERRFLSRTQSLCAERNLPLAKVKNARDLASCASSPILPGKVYRMGRVSDATAEDLGLIFDEIGVKTLVDLRSPTELKDDPTLEREEVFKDFTSIVWKERGRAHDGVVKELGAGEPRIRRRRSSRNSRYSEGGSRSSHVREVLDGIRQGMYAATHDMTDEEARQFIYIAASSEDSSDDNEVDEDMKNEDCDGCLLANALLKQDGDRANRKERHFVSLMNEFKYVRGTLSKLRKRDIARALLQSPAAAVSKRARERVKGVFLEEINDGGLAMLNELLLRFGAPGIRYVLELCADKNRHPIAFYCTAGKDRTGMIAAIILSLLGVPDEDIVEDYSLSANVYAEMNDHKAMVGALSQRNLDPKTFLGAPPQVMRDTLVAIRKNYGSVEGYLDWIGFGKESQEKLKAALLSDA